MYGVGWFSFERGCFIYPVSSVSSLTTYSLMCSLPFSGRGPEFYYLQELFIWILAFK